MTSDGSIDESGCFSGRLPCGKKIMRIKFHKNIICWYTVKGGLYSLPIKLGRVYKNVEKYFHQCFFTLFCWLLFTCTWIILFKSHSTWVKMWLCPPLLLVQVILLKVHIFRIFNLVNSKYDNRLHCEFITSITTQCCVFIQSLTWPSADVLLLWSSLDLHTLSGGSETAPALKWTYGEKQSSPNILK